MYLHVVGKGYYSLLSGAGVLVQVDNKVFDCLRIQRERVILIIYIFIALPYNIQIAYISGS